MYFLLLLTNLITYSQFEDRYVICGPSFVPFELRPNDPIVCVYEVVKSASFLPTSLPCNVVVN